MKVAVVGSGVSGLAATWLLNEYSDHEVHLFEADDRPGGHAHTVQFTPPDQAHAASGGVDVDTGFIVLNPSTYPNFLRFLRMHPSTIKILPTEMTFSVSRDNGAFEWAGKKDVRALFCQGWKRLLDPGIWRMIYDVLRFNACAREVLVDKRYANGVGDAELTIGEYLSSEGYSVEFVDNYLIPMTAAIWSTPPDKCALDFPARTLVQFLHNHHLLQVTGKPSWLTLQGGSRTYVETILSKLPDHQLHLSTAIISLTTFTDPSSPSSSLKPKVQLLTGTGKQLIFDHVILACHSDTSLQILQAGSYQPSSTQKGGAIVQQQQGITKDEARILRMFDWNKNEAVLHADVNLMPKSKLAWSCWNYLTKTSDEMDAHGRRKMNVNEVSLTYGMNDLQHIPESKYGPVLVTLNPPKDNPPKAELTIGRWKYDHPILDTNSVRGQGLMPQIQNKRSISFAGAWLRYGFHEDGFTSGLLAALSISSSPPGTEKTAGKSGNASVRTPFEVVLAHTDPTFTLPQTMLFWFFKFVELMGIRVLVGNLLGCGRRA